MTTGFFNAAAGRRRGAEALFVSVVAVLLLAAPVIAASTPVEIGSDPFTQATCAASSTTNHQANVEPDSFSNGSTIVATYQVGRVFDGGRARSASRPRQTTAPPGPAACSRV